MQYSLYLIRLIPHCKPVFNKGPRRLEQIAVDRSAAFDTIKNLGAVNG